MVVLRKVGGMTFVIVVWLTCGGVDQPLGAASTKRAAPIQAEYGEYFPVLVTRATWQAKPALPGMIAQEPAGIILHHTGTRKNLRVALEAKLRNLQAFS